MSDQGNDGPDLGGLARGAAVFVVAMAAVFGVIGLARDDTGGTEILDGPVASEAPTGNETQSEVPTGTETGTPDPSATGSATDPATPGEGATGTDQPTSSETETSAASDIDPASVSVQVLDGTTAKDGTDDEVAGVLGDAGYDVVAINSSVNIYERTTVFYTAGNEPAAQQIADEFGYSVVEPAPDNLNQSVDVHLVVGDDA